MKKLLKMIGLALVSFIILIGLFVFFFFKYAPQIGGKLEGDALKKAEQSPNFKEGVFQNLVETNMDMPISVMASSAWKMLKGTENGEPSTIIETLPFSADSFEREITNEILISWFGHSTALIKMAGKTILADPVFSERASMFSFLGPKNFEYNQQYGPQNMPHVDAIIISHDHYDHLDYETITAMKSQVSQFFVPLGVGVHLVRWGVDSSKIIELDWWQSAMLGDSITLTLAPTRHFSGRGFDRFTTLWGAWSIASSNKKVFFGGDSGYFPGFKEIGERLGPFDITLLECGQYNENWKNIHMMPEETVQAHIDLKGNVLMPIHWGKFMLSLHPWKEPVERMEKVAQAKGVNVATPRIGEFMLVHSRYSDTHWWEKFE